MIREAFAAGKFYPSDPVELRAMIGSMVDERAEKEEVIGLLSPHAGYPYSGPVAAATFSRVIFADTFVIIGPNHTGAGKPFSIMTEGVWQTPLGDVNVDEGLASKILAGSKYLEEDTAAHLTEHSIEVQLPFLQYFRKDVMIVPIVIGVHHLEALMQTGRDIAKAVREVGRRVTRHRTSPQVIIIASGDLTHYEPHEEACRKDALAMEAIMKLDAGELARRVREFAITACAEAPAIVMISAAGELGANHGMLVKYQTSGDATGDRSAVVGYGGIIIKGMSSLVRLAHRTIETYVKEGRVAGAPDELTPEMTERAGVFVSIHKGGELRGCIGTFEPAQKNVAQEVIANAISSATRDPRFSPVRADELKELDINVDVLTHPEPVEHQDELDPKKYGVIVQCGWRRGLLLPDLEGVDSVEQQIDICCSKGGIGPNEPRKLYRFEVKRYR